MDNQRGTHMTISAEVLMGVGHTHPGGAEAKDICLAC